MATSVTSTPRKRKFHAAVSGVLGGSGGGGAFGGGPRRSWGSGGTCRSGGTAQMLRVHFVWMCAAGLGQSTKKVAPAAASSALSDPNAKDHHCGAMRLVSSAKEPPEERRASRVFGQPPSALEAAAAAPTSSRSIRTPANASVTMGTMYPGWSASSWCASVYTSSYAVTYVGITSRSDNESIVPKTSSTDSFAIKFAQQSYAAAACLRSSGCTCESRGSSASGRHATRGRIASGVAVGAPTS